MKVHLSKRVIHLVERHAELEVRLALAHRQVIAVAVLKVVDMHAESTLDALYDEGAALGADLTTQALCALGGAPSAIQSYGKAALVGTALPLECGAALLHPRFGKAVRAALPWATTIMPSVTKRGAAGSCIDIPLHGVADMWSFDHFDAVSLCVPDSPAPDEVLIAVALAERGRPLARTRPDTQEPSEH